MPLCIKTTLRDETLRLLADRPARITFKRISKDTGLPESWLSMFGNGSINDPSVNRIETLYEYLTGRSITIPAGR